MARILAEEGEEAALRKAEMEANKAAVSVENTKSKCNVRMHCRAAAKYYYGGERVDLTKA